MSVQGYVYQYIAFVRAVQDSVVACVRAPVARPQGIVQAPRSCFEWTGKVTVGEEVPCSDESVDCCGDVELLGQVSVDKKQGELRLTFPEKFSVGPEILSNVADFKILCSTILPKLLALEQAVSRILLGRNELNFECLSSQQSMMSVELDGWNQSSTSLIIY
ncbi:hypothetical protein MLD38_005814 [Melastoma candidum]|uniref:Uncharacterized protein n=1 Tax=Melastoma candidum TaxID=119954 RepID=A0ACB9RQ24_9MYRT|nr:hypothetical protein MLD38_005814 [Melastoma candidum]